MGVALFASVWLTLIVKPANNQNFRSALVTPETLTTEIRMKPSVILYKTLPDDLQQRLEEHFTVTQVKNLRPETVSQHADAFAQAEGLLGSSEKVDAALLEKMPKLRATSTISVGYDNFDVEALNARKVLLMHTPTVLTETVADT
jgi:gluconate 2-dehydrogenase